LKTSISITSDNRDRIPEATNLGVIRGSDNSGRQIMVLEDTSHIMMFLRAGNGEIDRGGYIRPQVLDLKRAI
jgi:hypothetical protein